MPPAGYSLAPPNEGIAVMDALDSDVDLATGRSELIPLTVGQYDDRWDVGLVAPATAALNGYVWLDNDLDGLQGPSAIPVPGVTVALYYSDGTLGQPLPMLAGTIVSLICRRVIITCSLRPQPALPARLLIRGVTIRMIAMLSPMTTA